MNTAIVAGSIGAIAKQNNQSLAESFISADIITLVDTSGSMHSSDSRGGRSRYEVACQELANLQNSMPGKIAVISFSDDATFCPSGIPFYHGGSTDLAKALRFAHVADVPGMQFIVISDGYPDSPDEALREAAKYKATISTIYVGPEHDNSGRDFLTKLATASGGKTVVANRAVELAASVEKLLLKA